MERSDKVRNLKEELQLAREYFRKLDTKYIEEQKQAQAARDIGQQRRLKDGHNWEQLLSTSGFDLAKIREYEQADIQRAKEIRGDVINRLSPVPPTILSHAQDAINVNSLAGFAQWNPPNTSTWWFSLQWVDRSAIGDCGSPGGGSTVFPRAETVGSGLGWSDSHDERAQCGLWFFLPAAALPGNVVSRFAITVWPYLDMHGYHWVRANDGLFTSKQAEAKFTIYTRISQYTLDNSFWSSWVVYDRNSDNVDEEGRIDFTEYANNAKGHAVVLGGEQVQIQIIAEAYCYSQGSGSHALMDFQTGSGNGVGIPFIVVQVSDLGGAGAFSKA